MSRKRPAGEKTMTTKTKAAPPRQPEFSGMPTKTKLVLRAEEYSAALEVVEDKKEAAEHRKEALIQQMKADKVTRAVCLNSIGEKKTFVLETLEKLKAKKGSA
jgi:hypothetical protein